MEKLIFELPKDPVAIAHIILALPKDNGHITGELNATKTTRGASKTAEGVYMNFEYGKQPQLITIKSVPEEKADEARVLLYSYLALPPQLRFNQAGFPEDETWLTARKLMDVVNEYIVRGYKGHMSFAEGKATVFGKRFLYRLDIGPEIYTLTWWRTKTISAVQMHGLVIHFGLKESKTELA